MVINPVTAGGRSHTFAQPADRREQTEQIAKEQQKQDSKNKRWRYDTQIRDHAHDIVDQLVFMAGRQCAQADAHEGRNDQREQRQFQRRREELFDILGDAASCDQGDAKIALERVRQPIEVLNRERVVEMHLLAQIVDHPIGRAGANRHPGRIARHNAGDDKDDDG